MMFRYGVWLLSGILLLAGCESGYKKLPLHEVKTTQTGEGKQSHIESEMFLAYHEVIERSPNVKSVTRITDLKGDREPKYFTISPDGLYLVYQAKEQENSSQYINLWKIATDGGTGTTRLTSGRYFDIEPIISPEGNIVCFASNRSSAYPKLWKIRTNGAGGITRITQSDAVDRLPTLTPDGKYILYTSIPINAIDPQIWSIGIDGLLPSQLREGTHPKISPDGKKVLYSQLDSETKKSKIWVMDIEATEPTQLTFDTECNDEYPSWSPDGTKILYASDIGKDSNGKRNHDIWLMNANGSNQTQLTTNGSTDIIPQFSSDGKRIYFLSNRGFFWDIWRMEIID